MSPRLIIVGGPNGAGKTTFAISYAELVGYAYLGADAIAVELSPHDVAAAAIAASREFRRRVDSQLAAKRDLAIESTLSGRTLSNIIRCAKNCDYNVSIIFLYLDSEEACVNRVRERVKKGGHDVPETDIRRRFVRSSTNFWCRYRPLVDDWTLIHNGGSEPKEVASGDTSGMTATDQTAFLRFVSEHGSLLD